MDLDTRIWPSCVSQDTPARRFEGQVEEPDEEGCWQSCRYVAVVASLSFESTWNTDVVLVDSECAISSSLQVGMEGFL